ncbi:MAG: NlpC/P60 family protein [Solirubrobacteraceae bacterium]
MQRDLRWRRRGPLRLGIIIALVALLATVAVVAVIVAVGNGSLAGSARHGHHVVTVATAAGATGPAVGGHPQPRSTAQGRGELRSVAEVRDPEEASSFPVPASSIAHRSSATAPATVAERFVAPGALSTSQIRAELGRVQALNQAAAGASIVPGGDSVAGSGAIPIPQGIPAVVQKVIAGANAITDYPYVYGGGHASFVDNAYDCSGSVSYALAAGGLVSATETSGELESWGAAGPGQWITVYASAGHVYMYVNIGGGAWMRYDTVGRSGPFASRWQPAGRSNEGFVARHWPGL